MEASTLLDYVGNTPIVKLQKMVPENCSDIYVKLEEFNPGGSIKSRVAFRMVHEAEKTGLLKPNSGQTIIEPTGGNTGIGLAIASAIRGYRLLLVIPDNYSKDKIKVLQAYGAEVLLSDSKSGNNSHIEKVKEILRKKPEYIWLDQLSNKNNPLAHYETTASEILDYLPTIDCFIAGVGSGGTITGIGKRVKEKFPDSLVIGVQPNGCNILEGKAVFHKIQGMAIGFVAPIFDRSIVDDVLSVEYEDAVECMKILAAKEGLFVGISSGANVYSAIKIAKKLGRGKTVVTVAPDSGRSYLDVFELPNSLTSKRDNYDR
jgi:cysteine synthase